MLIICKPSLVQTVNFYKIRLSQIYLNYYCVKIILLTLKTQFSLNCI